MASTDLSTAESPLAFFVTSKTIHYSSATGAYVITANKRAIQERDVQNSVIATTASVMGITSTIVRLIIVRFARTGGIWQRDALILISVNWLLSTRGKEVPGGERNDKEVS